MLTGRGAKESQAVTASSPKTRNAPAASSERNSRSVTVRPVRFTGYMSQSWPRDKSGGGAVLAFALPHVLSTVGKQLLSGDEAGIFGQ